MTTSEKVAYLKGLAEGYGMDPTAREGKLLATIIDILEDLALDLEDVMDSVDELEEGLDVVSDDLADVEDVLFDEEDEDELEEDDEELYADGERPTLYEVECPSCGEIVTFEESVLEQGGIQCPACGESLEFLGEDDDAGDEEIPF